MAMRSRSRTVSRRRRTLPASETAIAAGWASSSATTRRTAGSAVPRSRLASPCSPTPASSAFRIFSSLRAPIPERSRSLPSCAADFRPARVVRPSCVQNRAAVFGPTPGSRRKSTTPAGTSPRRLVSACISPSLTTSTTLFSIVLPIPGSSFAFPSSASSAMGTADSLMRVAARRYAITLKDSSSRISERSARRSSWSASAAFRGNVLGIPR